MPGVTVMVGLLRGINVGGHNTLAMADLRSIVEGCGHREVGTYIQSGNLAFATDDADPSAVAGGIAAAILSSTGLSVGVTVRTRSELTVLAAGNPFLAEDDDPTHHHLLFRLASTPLAPAELAELDELDARGGERIAPAGRDAHLHLPGGIGRSRLATALARRTAFDGTIRNWRTVCKLLEMADERGA